MANILVPVDGSRNAMRAIDYAIRLANGGPLELHLLTVAPPLDDYGMVAAYLSRSSPAIHSPPFIASRVSPVNAAAHASVPVAAAWSASRRRSAGTLTCWYGCSRPRSAATRFCSRRSSAARAALRRRARPTPSRRWNEWAWRPSQPRCLSPDCIPGSYPCMWYQHVHRLHRSFH